MSTTELNADQARETVNARQRFESLREARRRAFGCRGSMTWHAVNGEDYLVRSYYDSAGSRRQKNEGRRTPDTETFKTEWERIRSAAAERLAAAEDVMSRQKAINKALGLGRLPAVAGRITRAIDAAGLLGNGLCIVGTNALYGYEAAAGVHVDAGAVATQDIDLLMDARQSLKIIASDDISDVGLMDVLRKADRSFERTRETFRAMNKDGYLVDLIRPLRNPPWALERDKVGTHGDDLLAVQIEGLVWLESSPPFESIVIDTTGMPLRMVTPDPRVFAAHKLWLSRLPSREPFKRRRDKLQATTVASMLATHLIHLSIDMDFLRMLPKEVSEAMESLVKELQTIPSAQPGGGPN